jgi:hypothetical protein
VLRDAEVGSQLLSIAAGDQRGDGDHVFECPWPYQYPL